jgi:hypothetical protein
MPTTTYQPTAGSTAASAIITGLRDRLRAVLVKDTVPNSNYVRIVVRPSPDYAEYKAEEGVALMFGPPMPEKNAGAGRWGKLTRRTLEVHIASQNMLDPAGQDDAAATAHLDLEEAVVNALEDWIAQPKLGVRVAWMEGGAEIERNVKRDNGMAVSVLLFEVEYVPPLKVNRD